MRDTYPDEVLGLKIRVSKGLVDSIAPLTATLEMANELGRMAVCVHVTNPACRCRT